MDLQSIRIKNYRSIEDLLFKIVDLDDNSFTYGLIGINEAGKSSILKALALRDDLIKIKSKDFRDRTKDIEIIYTYKSETNREQYLKELPETVEPELTEKLKKCALLNYKFQLAFPGVADGTWTLQGVMPNAELTEEIEISSICEEHYLDAIFWTAEDKYLISEPINLSAFALKPADHSIPLKNCFILAGINNIKERIDSLGTDSTEIQYLCDELGEKVTEHIQSIWPNHPIKISFLITNGLIHFHVHDLDTKNKAKTTDQRSDGFKQFISFLLTISAQNRNKELSNSLLLLDEPETHLHPKAQEFLLSELIKITQGARNNIVFFATHSNYMIDKHDLSRNFRVAKANDVTKLSPLNKKLSSYASVTYEVFEIPNTDYHNELYGKIHQLFQDNDPSDEKREKIKYFDSEYLHTKKGLKKNKPLRGQANSCTLPTFIRNCIHHPDNGDRYTEKELKESIDLLRDYLINVDG